VPNGATSGNVVVTVGGAASNGANFAVTVAPLGASTSLHATVGALPVSWYYDDATNYPATLFSTYGCPGGSSVRGCFKSFISTLRDQGVTGIREYLTTCDASSQAFTNGQSTPSCDPTQGNPDNPPAVNPIAVNQTWVDNLATFFSDVQGIYKGVNIQYPEVAITISTSGPNYPLPASKTFSPQTPAGLSCASTDASGKATGNCCVDTPGSPGGPPDPVKFNPIIPFGLNSAGGTIGDATLLSANNQGYLCAPINDKYFVGWNNLFNLVDKILGAAAGKVTITQLEFLQAEVNLYQFPAQLRYIIDTYQGHAAPGTTQTDVLSELRTLMTNHGFDPGRVAWSAPYMDPSPLEPPPPAQVTAADVLSAIQANCTNVYTDYGRNTAVDELAAAIGGSYIGNPYLSSVDTGFPCGGSTKGSDGVTDFMFQTPYYNTQPNIIDAHMYPAAVNSSSPGGGADSQLQSTPDQSQAVIQAVAQTDYSDLIHLPLLVPSLQSATFIIGETYWGTIYPDVVPKLPSSVCWSAPTSAPAANALGFEQSALSGYPVIFRPFMTLEDAADGCENYGKGPASAATYPSPDANYQNVNLNGQGPYTPTKQ